MMKASHLGLAFVLRRKKAGRVWACLGLSGRAESGARTCDVASRQPVPTGGASWRLGLDLGQAGHPCGAVNAAATPGEPLAAAA